MTPEVILRELGQIAIGDIELETTDGQKLVLRRVARPMGEQKRILEALRLVSRVSNSLTNLDKSMIL